MDFSPPTSADLAASDANSALDKIKALEKRVADMERFSSHQHGRADKNAEQTALWQRKYEEARTEMAGLLMDIVVLDSALSNLLSAHELGVGVNERARDALARARKR